MAWIFIPAYCFAIPRQDGIQRMTTGARATITMSSSLAYGYSGVPGLIPANADLVFEVWLISVNGCKNMV